MPSHNSVAARVRKSKELHPEKFCLVPTCLWRTPEIYCPKHKHLIVQLKDSKADA